MQLDVDVEAASQPVDGHLDVNLAHSREELLPGLPVAVHPQRRVLLGEPAQARGHLLLVALGLRVDREAHHRLGEVDVRRLDRNFVVDEHVTRDDVLELRDSAEIADAQLVDLLVVLALQDEDLADPLLGMRARIDERRVVRDRSREDAETTDAARERIGDRLEDEHRLLGVAELDRRPLLRR